MNSLMIMQIALALVLGLLIGAERQYNGSEAGMRTYALVAVGSCLFGLVSTHAQGGQHYQSVADPTRIASLVVSGIGFLCAGVIFNDKDGTKGLTTAATLWVTSSMGLALAFAMYGIAVFTAFISIALLLLNHMPWINRFGRKN